MGGGDENSLASHSIIILRVVSTAGGLSQLQVCGGRQSAPDGSRHPRRSGKFSTRFGIALSAIRRNNVLTCLFLVAGGHHEQVEDSSA